MALELKVRYIRILTENGTSFLLDSVMDRVEFDGASVLSVGVRFYLEQVPEWLRTSAGRNTRACTALSFSSNKIWSVHGELRQQQGDSTPPCVPCQRN